MCAMMKQTQEIRLAQTLKLVMTQNLQLAIKLLQFNSIELKSYLEEELLKNPFLEVNEEKYTDDSRKDEFSSSEETNVEEFLSLSNKEIVESVDWEHLIDDRSDYSRNSLANSDDDYNFEQFLSKEQSLYEYLEWQVGVNDLTEIEKSVANQIIGNINEKGYLEEDIETIGALENVSIELAEKVLKIVQSLDPVGVASRNIKECLLNQLDFLDINFQQKDLAKILIKDHLELLEKNEIEEIGNILNVSEDDILLAISDIKKLEPIPARNFSSTPLQHIVPDVYIIKSGEELKIILNDDYYPSLKVNKSYSKLINQYKNQKKLKNYLSSKKSDAEWLIKSLDQRERTLYKVAEAILSRQYDFFIKGKEFLNPLVLKDIAEDIEVHECTVSRIANNKFMYTPFGVFNIKYFFKSGVKTSTGNSISVMKVKTLIKELVDDEDKRRPLSDGKIALLLKNHGITIARRTVTKYRKEDNIPKSSARKVNKK